jgi:hypothetical protein
MLKGSPFNTLKGLVEVARQIDNGSLDVTKQISEVSSEAHREFQIGVVVTIGVIIFFCVAGYFILS